MGDKLRQAAHPSHPPSSPLQEEVAKEAQRQSLLARSSSMDERERVRITRIFHLERELAKERILGLSSAIGLGVTCI